MSAEREGRPVGVAPAPQGHPHGAQNLVFPMSGLALLLEPTGKLRCRAG